MRMKLLLAPLLSGISFVAEGHTHYCDHVHHPNGTVTYDCGGKLNVSSTASSTNPKKCAGVRPQEPATAGKEYRKALQEYCEIFSEAVHRAELESTAFCASIGLTPKISCVSRMFIMHPHGENYCHQDRSFKCE